MAKLSLVIIKLIVCTIAFYNVTSQNVQDQFMHLNNLWSQAWIKRKVWLTEQAYDYKRQKYVSSGNQAKVEVNIKAVCLLLALIKTEDSFLARLLVNYK